MKDSEEVVEEDDEEVKALYWDYLLINRASLI